MLDDKTLAEWEYAAREMHLPPSPEQAVELIEIVRALRREVDGLYARLHQEIGNEPVSVVCPECDRSVATLHTHSPFLIDAALQAHRKERHG